MTQQDQVVESMEQASALDADITQAAYREFYQRCPQARELMQHVDPHMQGRMLSEVIELLLTPPEAINPAQMRFEVRNHAGYGVDLKQYRPLFEAVHHAVRALLADNWDQHLDDAWDQRIDALMAHVRNAHATSCAQFQPA